VALAVSDDGCGMSPEVQARIYEPFYTTKALGRGTGLGLATVYGVVRQNKGFIRVESAVGQGTTFHIHFPRCQTAALALQAQGRERSPQARPGETVLVVEDNVAFLETLQTFLALVGYRVLIAANQPALSLVLSDVTMPGTDGFTLAKQVQSKHPNLRFLFMSGYPGNGISQQDHEIIQKPFTLSGLAQRLRAVLDSQQG